MKKKNIIVLTSMSMIALSSGFFGITKVGNFSYFTKAQNEIGTFTLSNEENVFSQGNKEYEITSNRNTKGQASLITWGTAEFTNKEDAFCHLYANDEDEAWINIEA